MVEKEEANQENKSADYHMPVLLAESIDALLIKPGGTYVDCTFGGGGHSRQILKALGPEGRLLGFDQDADAAQNKPDDDRFIFVPHNFRHLGRFLRLHKIEKVDGILADLGVSSHQFNEPERGFSIRYDANLDMRMDVRQELTAARILKTYSAEDLQKLFSEFGEVTNAKTLAATIVKTRETAPLNTINQFKSAVHDIVKGNPNKYFAQVFQALRIVVNDEFGALKELLEQVPAALGSGGRIAIITFHSLEDRIVKNFFKHGSFEQEEDLNPFENTPDTNQLRIITKKPIVPTAEEQKRNSRSRSAKLRVAEKK